MAETVLANFSVMLDNMDFARELRLLGIRKFHFRQRKKALRELKAMSIGLWRLGLERSFPSESDTIFERFMLSLYEQVQTAKARTEADAFDILTRAYVDKFRERGDADFTTVSGYIVSLFHKDTKELPSKRLKLALLMRDAYMTIFRHLI